MFKCELWLPHQSTPGQVQVVLASSVCSLGHADFHGAKNFTVYIFHCSIDDCYIIKVYLDLLECSHAKDWEIRNKLSQGIKVTEVLERPYWQQDL